ncbi:hypothetical protein [Paraburkholderia sp. RL17-337-BIB-A]
MSRIKALDATLLTKEGYEHSTLFWNLRGSVALSDQVNWGDLN